MDHSITRHRHEVRRRRLTVADTRRLTPNMIRMTLAGEDLADFTSLGADDHVKIFVPGDDGAMAMRDYTPRAFDRAACTLTIDFAVHEAGPATRWAVAARPGDRIDIGGPRGSTVVSLSFAWWLLIGDETALPSIGRRLAELPAGVRAISLAAVTGAGEEQTFATAADHRALWVHRPAAQADDPAPLLAALSQLDLPGGDGFVWIGAEARVARALRDDLTRRGHPREWMKASGYWRRGEADAHDKLGE
jgi:NADPH-dependent ferric siderophore reductase